MAGRPKKAEEDKKIREAIYFEPLLHDWLKGMADDEGCTVSVIVNRIVKKAKEQEG